MAHDHLDHLDTTILRMLSSNARKPYLEIARECGVSGAAVHQRIQKLIANKIIKGSESLVDPQSLGYETCCYIGFLMLDPSKTETLLNELRKIPEVVDCHMTSGKYDILTKIYARNNQHLYDLIRERFSALGYARTETLISFSEVFHRPIPIKPEQA